MSETNNNINFSSNEKNSKKTWFKKLMTIATIALALSGIPKESKAETEKKEEIKVELATNLQNWDEKQDKLRSKEEMTIDYIGRNLYINWKSADELEADIQKISENLYSIEFKHEFLEWPKNIKMVFETKYENNSISMNFQNYQIDTEKWMRVFPTNNFFEIDKTTHNKYDVRTVWNWKRENFNIVYNDYKTKQAIENIVKGKEISPKTKFEYINEFENTQLTWLNNPYLWKEVFQDEDWYYRTLFYSTKGKKFDITNIYFNPNWEFNAEKTAEKQEKLTILWIEIDYEINQNGEFIISEQSKQELIEKVKQDRKVLIETINNTPVADFEVFSGLNKIENAGTFQFDSKIIFLDPISWIYSIKLNNDKDKNLESLYCKVDWENFILVDETGKTANNAYFNYETNNKKETNYYRINKNGEWLIMTKISKKLENPKENLPYYTWDTYAIGLLRKSGNLTNYKDWYLNHFDSKWNLIAKMPCNKLQDWWYEFNEEKYHTKIEALKLYKYHWFNTKVQKIDELAAELWIVDADIRDIFEKSLKNDWLDFNQNVVEITNPETGESIYYNMDPNFTIKEDKHLYDIAEKQIDLMQNRLELAQIVNNSKVLWKNGKQYKDFEQFIWWEAGIGKQIISPEQLKKFISGESDEITVKISRWKWEYTDIIYTASGKKLKTRLKSGEWKWTVYLNPQRYTIKTEDKSWNIILDPKEERE